MVINDSSSSSGEDDEELEVVVIDQDTEDLAYFLTLMMKTVNPKISCGPTYELLVRMLIKLVDEGLTNDEAITIGKEILAAREPDQKH